MLKRLLVVMVVIFFPALVLMQSCSWGKTENEAIDIVREQNIAESSGAVIEFEKTTHDFGKLFSGEKVIFAFRFTNTGDTPLVITNTRSGCGCTVGEYSRDPISPGGSGRVNVMFDSAGRRGFQNESIRVFTNAVPSEHVLRITAEVIRD